MSSLALRYLIKIYNYKFTDIAEALNIKLATINMIVSGHRNVTKKLLTKMANFLNFDIKILIIYGMIIDQYSNEELEHSIIPAQALITSIEIYQDLYNKNNQILEDIKVDTAKIKTLCFLIIFNFHFCINFLIIFL